VPTAERPLIFLMPVYDDWKVLTLLAEQLDHALGQAGLCAEILVVDDGSPTPASPDLFRGAEHKSIRAIRVVRLGRNMGHQRAIAVGLAFIEQRDMHADVVVMDADGEDAPADALRLVHEGADHSRVMFAQRAARSEGLRFRIFYRLYQLTYRLLTGTWIAQGNFSFVPREMLPRLVMLSELWSHYPAAVLKARVPVGVVPIDRATRLAGHSQMRLTSLVLHGLSAVAVHGDVIGVRALGASLLALGLSFGGIATVVAVRLFSDLAIPGWASYLVGLFVIIGLQAISLSAVFVFMVLNSRNYFTAIPRRDYGEYVMSEEFLYPCSVR
jgi:polyisoprenyl-phosphate glycosyltransferase